MGDKYEVIGKLGEGGFGIVNKAKDKETGGFVAVKKQLEYNSEQGTPPRILREIGFLNLLSNPITLFVSMASNIYMTNLALFSSFWKEICKN
ncbi:putative cyclin-dependent kinase CMGC-CDK-Pl family [Helianthus annuus]|nr:putative cyclin-dependent kinase CMGC-CDK-Pl family [Helianthus annuus]